jgi:hypothetical protein
MDALDSRIRELVAYARERDGEDRTNLFRNLVDLFLTGKAPHASPTRNQLLDVLEALIPHVEAESRRTACDLVAAMSSPPMDLVMRLARDRASLVASLLMHSGFDEEELIELIEQTGREHHQVIASREDLSANVWIALARAAPAAPPFDHQSTLALWSDDLGITQTRTPSETPEATASKKPEQHRATVTPLHPEGTKPTQSKSGGNKGVNPQGSASIRILRTDEDLIAARSKDAQPTGLVDKAESADTAALQEEVPANDQHTAAQEIVSSATNKQAKDPGPGGWAWVSDRDGFITSVSPFGAKILGEDFGLIGSSMLDLLGLNTKLGHPVARAFQRRSAIHDAPISLQSLEDGQQHWTLEATPFFSAGGGIFEGYEGVLTPVVPASDEENLLRNDDDASALFLDEIGATSAGAARPAPATFTETASVFAPITSTATAEDIATFTTLDCNSDQLSEEQTIMPSTAAESGDGKADEPKTGVGDMLSTAAASAIKEVLAEALTGKAAAIETKATTMEAAASAPTVDAHVSATLDMLEEALSRMIVAGQKSGDPQFRLQGEIANACIRSLKDQLAGTQIPEE